LNFLLTPSGVDFESALYIFTMEIHCHHLDYFCERSGKLCSAGWNAESGLGRKFHDYSLFDYIRRSRMGGVITDLGC
jgi:hypothetical protein